MSTLASPGIGSGLDVNGIVSSLMKVESQPLTALNTKEASYQAKLSAYGSLQGVLSSLQSSVSALNNPAKFQAYSATPSDNTVLSASASSIATSGNYAITVGQLAQAQTVSTSGKASTTAAIAAAGTSTTLTFQFGAINGTAVNGVYNPGATFTQDANQASGTVTITDANNSLQGIRDTINAANLGVTASIVNDGSATPYRLVLTSNSTGSSSSMKVSIGGGADASLTSLLAYDPAATQNITQSTTAQNATLTVNGVAISSASNAVTGAVSGVTLNLAKGGTTNLSVARDTSSVASAISAFVDSYNNTTSTLKNFTSYDPTTKKAGILLGDTTTQLIQSRVRRTLSTALSGLGSSSLTSLSQIGISFQKDGSLTLDNTKLQTAIANNFGDMSRLFAAIGKPTDSLVSFISSTSASTSTVLQGAIRGSDKGTQAVQTGSVAAGLNITTGTNNQFNISVDGGAAVSVTLTQGLPYASASALATEVQTQINAALTAGGQGTKSVSVAADASGKISITSSAFGSNSGVSVTALGVNTGMSSLLGTPVASTAATITAGVNDTLTLAVDGISATVTLTAGTYTASGLAGMIQSTINSNPGFSSFGKSVTITPSADVLTITSNSLGSSSAVSVTGGTAKTNLLGLTPTASSNAGQLNGTQPGSYALSVSTLAKQALATGTNNGTGTKALQTGSVAAGLNITAGSNDQLNISVDGGAAVLVTLAQGLPYASASALATEAQNKINAALTAGGQGTKSVSVAADATGKISITSNTTGSTSGINVTTQAGNTGMSSLLGTPASSAASTITTGVNDTLALIVDGVSATVTLAAGSYTTATLAAQIQSAVNGTAAFSSAGIAVSVTSAANALTITSDKYGSTSSVSVTGGTANISLFGTTPTSTAGADVAGTINGVAAIGSGQYLTGVTGNAAEGLKVQVLGGVSGARGTIDYSQGYAYNLNRLLDTALTSPGMISTSTDGINSSIAAIAKQRDVLNTRMTTIEARYRKQFTDLDTLISSLSATSNRLTSLLSSLPKSA